MAKIALVEKLLKNSKLAYTNVLNESESLFDRDCVQTAIPALNIALSGDLDEGLYSGITQFAGPSKHFKTMFALVCASAYLKQYPDAVMLFYDCEFGSPPDYFDSLGIDLERVVHTPFTNIEELKFDLIAQLDQIERGDKVVIVIDSIGNSASKKEIEDTLAEKSSADMTRAKQLKSIFRQVTPIVTLKDIPMVIINHTYEELALFPKTVVGGGTGSYYASETVLIIGRQQEKEGTDVVGYNFVINVDKSRRTQEKSKIPISVLFQGGVYKYSGLLDMGLESGHIVSGKKGFYGLVETTTGEVLSEKEYREKDFAKKGYFDQLLQLDSFKQWVRSRYKISKGKVFDDEDQQ